jgi:hypothetical protein
MKKDELRLDILKWKYSLAANRFHLLLSLIAISLALFAFSSAKGMYNTLFISYIGFCVSVALSWLVYFVVMPNRKRKVNTQYKLIMEKLK